MRILALDGIHADGLTLFRNEGWFVETGEPIKDPARLPRAEGVDAVLVRSPPASGGRARRATTQLSGRAGAGVEPSTWTPATRAHAVITRGRKTCRRRARDSVAFAWRGTSRGPTPA